MVCDVLKKRRGIDADDVGSAQNGNARVSRPGV